MPVTYGGITLEVASVEVQDWITANITLRDILEFSRRYWPGSRCPRLTYDPPPPERPIRLGSLYWPKGASRFAVAHFLATDDQVTALRATCYTPEGSAPQRFSMIALDANGNLIGRVDPYLYMLPPHPIQSQYLPNQQPGQWLLTLVDQRFFWRQLSTGVIEVTEGVTLWSDVYNDLATAIGAPIVTDMQASPYLKPSVFISSKYSEVTQIMDAVAYNCGQRIVRDLAGNVHGYGTNSSSVIYSANIAAVENVQAGFEYYKPDTEGVQASRVAVFFPRPDTLFGTMGAFPTATPVASEVAGGYLSVQTLAAGGGILSGDGFTKFYHDTALSNYSGDALNNQGELDGLAIQVATDYATYAVPRADLVIAGIFPWVPEGFSDSVEWIWGGDNSSQCCTRVIFQPLDDQVQDLMHLSSTKTPQAFGSFFSPTSLEQTGGPLGLWTQGEFTQYDPETDTFSITAGAWGYLVSEEPFSSTTTYPGFLVGASSIDGIPVIACWSPASALLPVQITDQGPDSVTGVNAYSWFQVKAAESGQWVPVVGGLTGTFNGYGPDGNPLYERNEMRIPYPWPPVVWIYKGFLRLDGTQEWVCDYERDHFPATLTQGQGGPAQGYPPGYFYGPFTFTENYPPNSSIDNPRTGMADENNDFPVLIPSVVDVVEYRDGVGAITYAFNFESQPQGQVEDLTTICVINVCTINNYQGVSGITYVVTGSGCTQSGSGGIVQNGLSLCIYLGICWYCWPVSQYCANISPGSGGSGGSVGGQICCGACFGQPNAYPATLHITLQNCPNCGINNVLPITQVSDCDWEVTQGGLTCAPNLTQIVWNFQCDSSSPSLGCEGFFLTGTASGAAIYYPDACICDPPYYRWLNIPIFDPLNPHTVICRVNVTVSL
jgi:hypothetical protein